MSEEVTAKTDNDMSRELRDKIVHILTIFPKLSYSMLQVGIGTSIQPGWWRPVIAQMIEDKMVEEITQSVPSPSGRNQSYTILSLVPQELSSLQDIVNS